MTKKGDYLVNMRALFDMLLSRERDVAEVHMLFESMYNYIRSRRELQLAETPEGVALARWGLELSNTELRELMRTWCLYDFERKVIRDLVEATP